MKAKGTRLYHISRENNWNVGDVLYVGEKENPFWSICKDYSYMVSFNGQPVSIFEMINSSPNFDVTQNNIESLYKYLKDISKEFSFYVREQMFEEIRQKYYPLLPSRQKCLWVCEYDQLAYWKTLYSSNQASLLI